MNGITAMDENGERSPMKRLGSTRKLMIFNNIRLQLNEQLRCLDARMESQVSLVSELQDFFRRRGEVELDYSKSLEKLAKSILLRHKEQKIKRDQWPNFSSYACWQQLVNQTKSLAKDHAALSEIYSVYLVSRLQTVIDDVQRIYKNCREIAYETHEEMLRILQELHTTMKTYHCYQTECKAAEVKLQAAEVQRIKLQQTIQKEKLERSKKYKLMEKEIIKRKNKYSDAKLKALKAKNEYKLCLEASNTTIHKYFVEDLSDLIDCMDLGFHSTVSRALLMHVTADQGRCNAILNNTEIISQSVHMMNSRADKHKFMEQYHSAFMIPKRLEFQGQTEDNDALAPELQKILHSEMTARLQHLGQRVSNLRAESEEVWKTLETAETNLLELLNTDYDTSCHFGNAAQTAKLEIISLKNKSDKQEMEDFYLSKIREYLIGTSRIARLDAKAELLRSALAKDSTRVTMLTKSIIPKRKRIGRINMTGQPKLFAGSLEEYLETTGEEIPLILRSCIRVINLFGLHHQGIFRVSGSQIEISNFREAFERGEDPLADTTDASDINSVAGVLKLYLRELREPLFPIIYFEHFIELAQSDSKQDLISGIKSFLQRLSVSVVIVIRYLFAFLNHLSEFSDENMMDAYNLAICFGPTLMPAPEDKDQVQYQNQVNELIKNMIVFYEEIFPKDIGGIMYEKFISQEPFDCDVDDSPSEQNMEDADVEVCPSEDDSEAMEATVQFDFNARSNRELSLRKGEHVLLHKQVSNDWWQGTIKGKDGLIPDKYISLKIKDEDREKNVIENADTNIVINVNDKPVVAQQQNITLVNVTDIDETDLKANVSVNDTSTVTCTTTVTTVATNTAPPSLSNSTTSTASATTTISMDKLNARFTYHDEPHSFESSMEFLENPGQIHYERRPRKEHVYETPSEIFRVGGIKKNYEIDDNSLVKSTIENVEQILEHGKNEENVDEIQLRSKFDTDVGVVENANVIGGRRSEIILKINYNDMKKDVHTRSLSLSDNRTMMMSDPKSLSHQYRGDVLERRIEIQTKSMLPPTTTTLSEHILLRNRVAAPDIVMDLPENDTVRSSLNLIVDPSNDDQYMSTADRFASHSQCTLRKNEIIDTKYFRHHSDELKTDQLITSKSSSSSSSSTTLLQGQDDNGEEKITSTTNPFLIKSTTTNVATTEKRKSPITIGGVNTQQIVSKFADLHLTGGCITNVTTTTTETTATSTTTILNQQQQHQSTTNQQQILGSFKPQIKMKPTILKKPINKGPNQI